MGSSSVVEQLLVTGSSPVSPTNIKHTIMEKTKEMLLKAYKEGKTIQSKSSGNWKDFEPQNQLDYPNFDYGSIENWRIKPRQR